MILLLQTHNRSYLRAWSLGNQDGGRRMQAHAKRNGTVNLENILHISQIQN